MYIDKNSLQRALRCLCGTANHLFKIWLVLKVMGLKKGNSVSIDTANSTPALKRLFSSGAPDGSFYVPFAHTKRFSTMKNDAARSIIQTTLQRWASSDSVVTCNPTQFISIQNTSDGKLQISEGRSYPLGLGHGNNGFALNDDSRVALPLLAMAIWVFVREKIENESTAAALLCQKLRDVLNLDPSEEKLVFVEKGIDMTFQATPLSESEIWSVCEHIFDDAPGVEEIKEDKITYMRKVRNMVTISDNPEWMQREPQKQLEDIIALGEKTILLYGPPRTGKTHAIDSIIKRDDPKRITIQMHEGWSYENLIMGYFPDKNNSGKFTWEKGAFLRAICDGYKYIVLEEINRTSITQALGEAFSLLENAYRGKKFSIKLPDGSDFYIPEDVTVFFTMNTIDASTEDVDDALLGRCAAVEFPPRIEALDAILLSNGIDAENAEKIKEVFNAIQANYPLGHGYFAQIKKEVSFFAFYLAKIRPVLANHFLSFRPEVVSQIDNFIDQTFKK